MEDASRMDREDASKESNAGGETPAAAARSSSVQGVPSTDDKASGESTAAAAGSATNQGVPQGVNMSAFMAQLASQMKIMVEETLAPQLEEIARMKEQMAQVQPPVHNVKVPVSHASGSKQSYASAAHSKDGDTNEDLSSRGGASKTSASTAPPVSRYSGKPRPTTTTTAPQTSFPKATMSEDVVEVGSLYVKASTTVGEIKSVAENTQATEISFQKIGEGLIQACQIADPRYEVELLRCAELPLTRNPKPDQVKVQGQLTLALKSEYAMNPETQIRTLKTMIQQVIWHKSIKSVPNMPKYMEKILFEINTVNHPQQSLFALVTGIDASWYETRDHLGLQHLVKEIVKAVPVNEKGELPAPFKSDARIWSNIGAVIYTSSKISFNGKYGKAIALAYANTPSGAEAAQLITSTYEQIKSFRISGGLPIIVSPFPKNNTMEPTKLKSKQRLSPVDKFATEVIRANNKICTDEYKVIDLHTVTDEIFNERSITNMSSLCPDAIAVLPRFIRGVSVTTRGINFVGTLVLQKKANTCIKEEPHYRKFFAKETPEIYPLNIDASDDEVSVDDFTYVSSRKASNKPSDSPKKQRQPDMRTLVSTITRNQPTLNTETVGFFFTYGGRGGQRSINIWEWYYGPQGAKYATHEVSGAYICRYDTAAEAWARMNLTVPGVTNREQLRKFHMSIPHTETNLSPTHSVYDGPHGHRPGAIAYTYTEDDDEEMILARMEATKRITGSANGLITKRSQWREWSDSTETKKPADEGENEKKQAANEDQPVVEEVTSMDEEEEDMPNSQEFSTQDFEKEIAAGTAGVAGYQDPTEATFDEPTMDTTPLKKRRVNSNPNDTAAAAAAASVPAKANQQRTSPRMVLCNKLCIPLPPPAVLFDVKAFLHEYRPGFGHKYKEQVILCRYSHYPEVVSACVEVPVDEVEEFQAFVDNQLFFGKYKTAAEVLTENQTIEPATTLDDEESQEHLEKMAKEYLIQHVKHAVHPKHDVELNFAILESNTSGEVMRHYLKLWHKDGDFTESKLPAQPINVLEEATKIKDAENRMETHKWGFDWSF